MAINGCKKGKAGERELSHALNGLLGTSCRRGQQHTGLEGKDVVGLDGIHIECKRVEKLNLDKAVQQSVRDASAEDVPAVFHRRNRQPWLVTVRLDDAVSFAERILENKAAGDSEALAHMFLNNQFTEE
ncbi:putative PDDEXK endonuclease [Thalassoglobus polymorphus]|nr:hypothetical protein [Thalassoglobus polymorphus]